MFYNVYKEKMFTIEIEDGREANHYSSRTLQLKEISSQPSFNERMPLNPRKTIDLTKPGGAEPPSPPPPPHTESGFARENIFNS